MGIVRRDSIRMTVLSYIGVALGALNKMLLFTKFLTPDQIGLTAVLIGVSAVYAQTSSLGTNLAIIKFFPYFNDKKRQHNGLFFWCLLISLIGFSFCTIVFLLFKNKIVHFYGSGTSLFGDYYYYIIPLGFSALLMSLLDGYLRMLYKNVVMIFLNEVVARVFVIISIVLYIIHWVNFHQFALIYITLNCMIGVLAVAYVIYLKQFFVKPIISIQWKKFKKYLYNYSAFTYANSMSNAYQSNMDVILVGGFASLHDAGIYSTVFFITTVMRIPYLSVVKITSSTVAYHWRKKNLAAIQKLYVRVSEINFIVGGGIFLILWIDLKDMLSFLPVAYMAGIPVFLFVGIGRLFDIVTGLNGHILLYSNKYRTDLLFSLFLLIVSFLLNWWLIPLLGIMGAAIAACSVLIVYNSLRIWYIWSQYRLFPFTTKYLLPLLWLIILCVAGWYIPRVTNVFIDGITRTTVFSIIFLFPLYYWKFSPDVNIWVNKHLSRYLKWQV